jgi:polyhydroxybutyrate depolymerase
MNRHFLRSLAAMMTLACGASAASAETIAINGVKRTFSARLTDAGPAPLVIVLHGNTQTGADMVSRTSWPAVAKREHFTAVFPDGLNRAWADLRSTEMHAGRTPPAGTDDVAFIAKLVETYVANGTADPKRVYVTGLSNGGAMTMTLACRRADLFAAAASVIMNFTDAFASACQPSRPIPMLMMNGTADPLIPYEGGRRTSRYAVDGFWSAEKTIAFWRKVSACEDGDAAATDLADKDPNDQSTVTLVSSRCPAGRDAVLYRINDGGHRMPGGFPDARFVRLVNAIFGPQNRDIDGAETIWAFFKRFP